MRKMVDIHADDYALTVNTSREMLELMKDGIFDSISIIPNSSCHDECIDILCANITSLPYLPRMSVHLNLVEGISLSNNDGSLIDTTWKSLFFASYIPVFATGIRKRIKSEINCQIRKCAASIDRCISAARAANIPCDQKKIRIDSHQHAHMIPVVRRALYECIAENGYDTEYIRNSKEPLWPFLSRISLIGSYRIVNIIKNRLLQMYSNKVDKYARNAGLRPMLLWGLIMSGKMDEDRIAKLYPYVTAYAEKHERDLEILFHPGRMGRDEIGREIPQNAADEFYLSVNRDTEKAGARRCRMLVKSDNSGRDN